MATFKSNGVVGTLLGQVFAVRIKHINGDVKNCQVYGNILVQDVDGPLSIYNKAANESECVHLGGTLSLAQPCRAIYASRNFSFYLDLKYMDENDKELEFINKCHIVILCSTNNAPLNETIKELFDRNRSVDIKGKMGVATIYYCLLRVAIPVLIEAKFELRSVMDSVRVSGTLVARYGKRFNHGDDDVAKEHSRVVLFSKKSDEAILVDRDFRDLINSFVAVPVYSSLILEANFVCVYSDGVNIDIISERKEFLVDETELYNESFKGKHDEIKYEVLFQGPILAGSDPLID